jgi:hypothetical protein
MKKQDSMAYSKIANTYSYVAQKSKIANNKRAKIIEKN